MMVNALLTKGYQTKNTVITVCTIFDCVCPVISSRQDSTVQYGANDNADPLISLAYR